MPSRLAFCGGVINCLLPHSPVFFLDRWHQSHYFENEFQYRTKHPNHSILPIKTQLDSIMVGWPFIRPVREYDYAETSWAIVCW